MFNKKLKKEIEEYKNKLEFQNWLTGLLYTFLIERNLKNEFVDYVNIIMKIEDKHDTIN